MLSFMTRSRYFLYREATDMRKSFDGLSGLVRQNTPHDILSGDVFIFINRRCDRIKLLMWDVSGFALYYKRLEKDTFGKSVFLDKDSSTKNALSKAQKTSTELSWSDLVMLLEGIEINSIKRRKRFKKAP
jgi:hypothetical protein